MRHHNLNYIKTNQSDKCLKNAETNKQKQKVNKISRIKTDTINDKVKVNGGGKLDVFCVSVV